MQAPGASTSAFQPPPPIAPQNSGPIRVPPLAPDRAAEYGKLFERAGPQNGVLQGIYLGEFV
jgi:epidermal growth factor receptor substrate 15